MAAEASRAPVVRERIIAPVVTSDSTVAFFPDPEDDMSGLTAWVDDGGRFFSVDDATGIAREYGDGEALPGQGSPRPAPLWSRVLRAIEPWYDWGAINTFRLEGADEIEGDVYRFEIQWLGVHFGIQLGRTPKAVR